MERILISITKKNYYHKRRVDD